MRYLPVGAHRSASSLAGRDRLLVVGARAVGRRSAPPPAPTPADVSNTEALGPRALHRLRLSASRSPGVVLLVADDRRPSSLTHARIGRASKRQDIARAGTAARRRDRGAQSSRRSAQDTGSASDG
ncbi:MAG: hypothetical protein MZV65_32205 [Chromatiales bacterium]|nr:hypothetical protein [Chromatiales bacterium]